MVKDMLPADRVCAIRSSFPCLWAAQKSHCAPKRAPSSYDTPGSRSGCPAVASSRVSLQGSHPATVITYNLIVVIVRGGGGGGGVGGGGVVVEIVVVVLVVVVLLVVLAVVGWWWMWCCCWW